MTGAQRPSSYCSAVSRIWGERGCDGAEAAQPKVQKLAEFLENQDRILM